LKLSVIIPVYDARTLSDCIFGLRSSILRPDEIIIVDDGSPEDLKPHPERDVRLIRMNDGPVGPSKARNRGALESTGDILVFVDADVVVHPDALGIIQSVLLDDPGLAAVFGSYDDMVQGGIVTSFKNLLNHYIHQKGRSEASTFWAGLGAVRRIAFNSVGGFDETLPRLSLEDIDLGMRLVRAGYRIRLCPRILGTHLKKWTLASLIKTDLFVRAIPWARLSARSGKIPNDLNANITGRLSVCSVWGGIALGVLWPHPWRWIAMAVGFGVAVILYLPLIRLFIQKGGLFRVICQTLLLIFYLAYGSLVFVFSFAYFKIVHRLRAG
jgi:GT2 family glycosyltransferase